MEILHNGRLNHAGQKVNSVKFSQTKELANDGKRFVTIDQYSMIGKDLILTQKNHYSMSIDSNDSLYVWKLINVDMADCDPYKLSRLLDNEYRPNELKEVNMGNRKRFIVYINEQRFVFHCDDIQYEERGYSRKEIADMMIEKENYLCEIEKLNSKLSEFFVRLCRFINRESIDYKNLADMNAGKENMVQTRSNHYLEILTRIKDKLDDLKKTLPESIFLH